MYDAAALLFLDVENVLFLRSGIKTGENSMTFWNKLLKIWNAKKKDWKKILPLNAHVKNVGNFYEVYGQRFWFITEYYSAVKKRHRNKIKKENSCVFRVLSMPKSISACIQI